MLLGIVVPLYTVGWMAQKGTDRFSCEKDVDAPWEKWWGPPTLYPSLFLDLAIKVRSILGEAFEARQ